MQIAQTILNQINCADRCAMMAWGAKNLVAMEKGLKFKSSGMVKKKCYVLVELDEGADLYDVSFCRIRKYEWIVDKKVEGVFSDQLVDVIDGWVG